SVLMASHPGYASCERVAPRLERAIGTHPDSPGLRSQLATLRIEQGRYQDAEVQYRRLIERNGRDAIALNNLAWLLTMNEGQHAEALSLIDRALQTAGPKPSLLDTRGLVSVSLGRTKDALRDLNDALAERPTASAYLHLAHAHLSAKDRIAAGAALQKAKEA